MTHTLMRRGRSECMGMGGIKEGSGYSRGSRMGSPDWVAAWA